MKSRAACSLPALAAVAQPGEISELDFAVGSWSEILQAVHIEWLNECYVRAMRAYLTEKSGGPFTAAHIYAEWQGVVRSGKFEEWLKATQKRLPRAADEIPPTPEYLEAMREFLRRTRMTRPRNALDLTRGLEEFNEQF